MTTTTGRRRTALDDHVEAKAQEMGISERSVRRTIKQASPDLYAKLEAQPSTRTDLERRMLEYRKAQGPGGDALREMEMPNVPFPAYRNPMIEGLVKVAQQRLADGESVDEVICWAAVHGWFEGRIAAATCEPQVP